MNGSRSELYVSLRERRLEKGIGLRELSRLIGYRNFSMVSDVEAGKRRVPPTKLAAWCKALAMDPHLAARYWLEDYCPQIAHVLFTDG